MISALFVQKGGVYYGLDNVDPWDEERDARLYNGPYPVIAHPPCQRWGRYWYGGPSCKERKILGDDEGCFESALASVRRWGGVIEHPESSYAWKMYGIPCPPKSGGWIPLLDGGFTCCVEQGHYGHRARKPTWLYAYKTMLPRFIWGKVEGKIKIDDGYHSTEERRKSRVAGTIPVERLSHSERSATPIEFRDILISMAESVYTNRQ